jgi:hypothetical protein
MDVDALFAQAEAYWRDAVGRFRVSVPDRRWAQAMAAITGHAAMTLNEGAPDVAVVNYNVFNRDGVYVANILQKCGRYDLAESAINYFLRHPFNGRVEVEADNPGQILWIMGQHWLFTRDRVWLERIYDQASQLAAMIRYYRSEPEPHYVRADSLAYGDALPADAPNALPANRRQVLRPGACDGTHPEYTEPFDIAGLTAASMLAEALHRSDDAATWGALAGELLRNYDSRYSTELGAGYGSYCVLWPCALYPFDRGHAHEQFGEIGMQPPGTWRYFPLATAHQGLLAGNRDAGWRTVEEHLAHPQMASWFLFDEGEQDDGNCSGEGGWGHYLTTWRSGVAMPHGWAIAEMWLLMRDCLVYENGGALVLFGGVADDWFRSSDGMEVENLPTHFGALTAVYRPTDRGATLTLSGDAYPPAGYEIALPSHLRATALVNNEIVSERRHGRVAVPPGTRTVEILFP